MLFRSEILTSKGTRILIDFGDDLDLDDTEPKRLPTIEGLTTGTPIYEAVFITHHHQDHCRQNK